MFVLEASFFSHRPVWSLILSGVFDRFPGLRLVVAEAGLKWIPNTLKAMDDMQAKQDEGRIGALTFIDPFHLERRPSEYWDSNCWAGASFMTREDAIDRDSIGVDHIMWGSDFPHEEGTFPYSRSPWRTRTPAWIRPKWLGWSAATRPTSTGSTSTSSPHWPLSSVRKLTGCAAGIDGIPETSSLAFEPRSATVS